MFEFDHLLIDTTIEEDLSDASSEEILFEGWEPTQSQAPVPLAQSISPSDPAAAPNSQIDLDQLCPPLPDLADLLAGSANNLAPAPPSPARGPAPPLPASAPVTMLNPPLPAGPGSPMPQMLMGGRTRGTYQITRAQKAKLKRDHRQGIRDMMDDQDSLPERATRRKTPKSAQASPKEDGGKHFVRANFENICTYLENAQHFTDLFGDGAKTTVSAGKVSKVKAFEVFAVWMNQLNPGLLLNGRRLQQRFTSYKAKYSAAKHREDGTGGGVEEKDGDKEATMMQQRLNLEEARMQRQEAQEAQQIAAALAQEQRLRNDKKAMVNDMLQAGNSAAEIAALLP
ncbi:hypothetical protein PSTG_06542 [Puccinia striiformis f. sp. tritici PST-78]|uniref:Uncharacterized protein n=1 Tax=Puccinia striiformis f. sp. tritici PST-78 TaxID=1165861 RepID=A0A0L0VM97_9BASI|nr:hypothetical protein PSTG_06542 [Puccinia striiformis f. sp. tritici PST-78]